MAPRKYTSHKRESAVADRRDQVLDAAAGLMRDEAGLANFSLDAVARAAGVTRLTVYNQFGSRRGLLEATFDKLADAGGLGRLADAMASASPRDALDRIVEIFCEFWNSDAAVRALNQATQADAELAEALALRTERRRTLFAVLVGRIARSPAGTAATRDAVDLLFMLTTESTYSSLRRNRSHERVVALVTQAAADAITRLRS